MRRELIIVSAAILERNVLPDVARRHKLLSLAYVAEFAAFVRAVQPGLGDDGATYFAAGTMASITCCLAGGSSIRGDALRVRRPRGGRPPAQRRHGAAGDAATLLAGCLVR